MPSDPNGGDASAHHWHAPLRHIRAGDLSGNTNQTTGMTRREAISGTTVGSAKVWMGQTHVAPRSASGDHHHGDTETAIYVVSGHPVFVFAESAHAPTAVPASADGEAGVAASGPDGESGESDDGGGGGGGDRREIRIETDPGDYVFVPPFVPHREENPGGEEAVVVIARSSQEAVVINLPSLWAPVAAPRS